VCFTGKRYLTEGGRSGIRLSVDNNLLFPRKSIQLEHCGNWRRVLAHLAACVIAEEGMALSLLTSLWTKLTPREHEVAELLLLGCDHAEIAKELTLARRTVKVYFNRMFKRAGLSDFRGIRQVKLAVMLHRERHNQQ
jgi:DNA-binding NarL/FixJ family response regulator